MSPTSHKELLIIDLCLKCMQFWWLQNIPTATFDYTGLSYICLIFPLFSLFQMCSMTLSYVVALFRYGMVYPPSYGATSPTMTSLLNITSTTGLWKYLLKNNSVFKVPLTETFPIQCYFCDFKKCCTYPCQPINCYV